ncbi:sugar MFS transporter [Alteromonas pelagimontana]|uniref:Sugar MFS transporter n=1 Tax=Alteromonas pelagimontana TaxID=1858656 RepID=A0A6M4MCA8_9ALTE|nr:sugar MFS transporter [Alteromonas pelagimontana]QJR80448.1 sugar MFS transporter [Alteromonas pelagimontana]
MTTTVTPSRSEPTSALVPMIAIGTLFFIFGFITWLNGALIPFLQIICDLSEIQALFVAFCFYIAYVVMALPMSWILDKTGYQKGMVIGLGLVALGLLLFVPAAKTHYFSIFLLAQFVVGSGLTILQTASNPYIVRIGPHESAAARIAVMGLLNKAAGVLAPILFTLLILSDFPDVSKASVDAMNDAARTATVTEMAQKVIVPYVGMAIAMLVLAAALFKVNLPAIREEAPSDVPSHESILRYPQLVLGALALFFYVGVEVIAGDTIGLYGSSIGISNVTSLTAYTMAAMVMGYLLGLVLIPKVLTQNRALCASAALGLILTVCILFASDNTTVISDLLWSNFGVPAVPDSVACIALLGLANAMCWPAIWPLALADLGKFTARGSALLIMGIAGGAILPLVYGGLANIAGQKEAYALLLVGYAAMGWYGMTGYKKRSW